MNKPATIDAEAHRLLTEVLLEMQASLARIESALTNGRPRPPRSPGRKAVNDADALSEVRDLMAQGSEQWAALKSVAMTMGGNWKAHHQRLRRKLRSGSRS